MPANLLLLFVVLGSATALPRPRHVVFMMTDDMGAELVEVYGGKSVQTPHWNRLADEGLKFERFYSNPSCTPSRATLISGRYPFRTGVQKNGPQRRIMDEDCTIGRTMKAAGYRTAVIGKWQMHPTGEYHHLVQSCGFDIMFAWHNVGERYLSGEFVTNVVGLNKSTFEAFDWQHVQYQELGDTPFDVNLEGVYSPDVMAKVAEDVISQATAENESLFLYYPMLLPHERIIAPPGTSHSDPQTGYRNQVMYADGISGRIINVMKDLNVWNESLYIFTSDNGAPIGRANIWGPDNLTVPGLKFKFEDSGVRVPLFICWPDVIEPGVSWDLGDFSDFIPTLMDLINVSLPDKSFPVDGQTLFAQSSFSRETVLPREWVYIQNNIKHSIRNHVWRIDDDGRLYNITQFYTDTRITSTAACPDADVLGLVNVGLGFGRKANPPNHDQTFGCTELACREDGTYECVESCTVSYCDKCFLSTGLCAKCMDGAISIPPGLCGLLASTSPATSSYAASSQTPTTTPFCLVEGCSRCTSESTICAKCQVGWRKVSHGKRCVPPPDCEVEHCARCRWRYSKRCFQCIAGFIPSGQGRACVSGEGCLVDNCDTCYTSNRKKCKSCKSGYYRANRKRDCFKMVCNVDHCEVCNPRKPNKCKRCQSGFELANRRSNCIAAA